MSFQQERGLKRKYERSDESAGEAAGPGLDHSVTADAGQGQSDSAGQNHGLTRPTVTAESATVEKRQQELQTRSKRFLSTWTRILEFDDHSLEEVELVCKEHLQLCEEERMLKEEMMQTLADKTKKLLKSNAAMGNRMLRIMMLASIQFLEMDKKVTKEMKGLKELKEQFSILEELLKEIVKDDVETEMLRLLNMVVFIKHFLQCL